LELSSGKASDTFDDVLLAPERDRLVEWLRKRPLIHVSGPFVLVHGGILPSWNLADATQLAAAAEKQLRKDPEPLFNKLRMAPASGLAGEGLTTREITRILTRIRCCSSPDHADLDYTGPPDAAPPALKPWFTFPEVLKLDRVFVFGHWAQMGCRITPHAWGLDSGCVYGGLLSAIRLDDGQLFQQVNVEE
jgi:bis(5'-nucleosyl)-tetraphosphatase (symmetrical)